MNRRRVTRRTIFLSLAVPFVVACLGILLVVALVALVGLRG